MSISPATLAPLPDPTMEENGELHGGLIDDVRMLWQQLLGLAHDHLQIAVLETRLAGQSLVAMVAAGVMVALLVVSSWIGLLAAAVAALVGAGLSINAAILLGAGANLFVALLLCAFIRRKSRHLRWRASLRSLASDTSVQKPERSAR